MLFQVFLEISFLNRLEFLHNVQLDFPAEGVYQMFDPINKILSPPFALTIRILKSQPGFRFSPETRGKRHKRTLVSGPTGSRESPRSHTSEADVRRDLKVARADRFPLLKTVPNELLLRGNRSNDKLESNASLQQDQSCAFTRNLGK